MNKNTSQLQVFTNENDFSYKSEIKELKFKNRLKSSLTHLHMYVYIKERKKEIFFQKRKSSSHFIKNTSQLQVFTNENDFSYKSEIKELRFKNRLKCSLIYLYM